MEIMRFNSIEKIEKINILNTLKIKYFSNNSHIILFIYYTNEY